jgi:hypothetical protein
MRVKNGWYPVKVEGRNHKGQKQFREVFMPSLQEPFYFVSRIDMTHQEYQTLNQNLLSQGYIQVFIQTFTDSGGIARYQSIWVNQK